MSTGCSRSIRPSRMTGLQRAISGFIAGSYVLAGLVLGASDVRAQVTPGNQAQCEEVDGPDVWVMDADGGEPRNLTNHPARDVSPSWSPDGSQIAFSTNRDCNPEIYLMNADGSAPRNITNTAGDGEVAPVWSPDGSRILYSLFAADNLEIYAMDPDGANRVNLTNDLGVDWSPAWSPDGTRIAFASNRSGPFQIYLMDADGENVTQLTDSRLDGIFPSWSATGDQIAYGTRRGAIRIVTADGTTDREVLDESALSYSVAWSPVEDRLIFGNNINRNEEIHSVKLDGTGLVNLTNHPADDDFPSWSPDGTRIAFSSDRFDPDRAVVEPVASPVAGGTDPVAIAELPSCGSRLDVVESTWALRSDCQTERSIVLQDGITLDGGGHTIWVVEPASGPFAGYVIERVGGRAAVTNVTISGAALTEPCDDQQWVVGIRFYGVTGTISDVTIEDLTRGPESHCGSGILVQGTQEGEELAATTVENNTIRGVDFIGIFARDRIEATITGNSVADAGHRGIVFLGPDATGTASGNTVEGAGNVGIGMEGSHDVVIEDNDVVDGGLAGIVAQSGASSVRIERNRVRGGRFGIAFEQAGTAGAATGNEVSGTSDHAIVAMASEASVMGNDLADIGGAGVASLSGSEITATDNRVQRANHGLIAVGDGSRGEFERNVIRDVNSFGLLASEGAEVTARDNSVTDAGRVGAFVVDGATAVVEDNTIIAGSIGISAHGAGTTALIADNMVRRTQLTGIGVYGGAEAHVTENTVEDTAANGIAMTDAGTSANIEDNQVLRAGMAGILVVEAAHADVTGNEVRGPAAPGGENRAGIVFWTETSGSIVANLLGGYTGEAHPGCAVVLAPRAGQIEVRDNRVAGSGANAQVCDARPGERPVATPA